MNKPTTYAISDIHGNIHALTQALSHISFNPTTDTLIVCGDMFDRGLNSYEVYKLLNTIPNRILLWGNHELMLLDTISRGYLSMNDMYNGLQHTIKSFLQDEPYEYGNLNTHHRLLSLREWMLTELRYYHTQDNHLFTHSFTVDTLQALHTNTYNTLSQEEKEDGLWGKALYELNTVVKQNIHTSEHPTLVFGHWHASDFYKEYNQSKVITDEIWTSDKHNAVALDTCTTRSDYLGVYDVTNRRVL